MNEQFDLSKKIIPSDNKKKDNGFIFTKDVKEFIRELKLEVIDFDWQGGWVLRIIDELAGKELIEGEI
jgi:hypothetical protein